MSRQCFQNRLSVHYGKGGGGGRQIPGRPPSRGNPPPVLTYSGGHCSGWCASCWNAFLLIIMFCISVHAVITADTLGLHAIDVKSKQLLWTTDVSIVQSKTSKAVTSLTTNGRGILFAVDMANHCVQMFSAINGHYLGYLITEEEFGIGRPLYVNWCENTSTFILVHQKEEKKCINFFKM